MDGKSTSQEQPADNASQRWCEILDVTPGATLDELERAYARAVSLIEGKSVGGYLMLDPVAAKSARDDVERAFTELKKASRPPSKKRKGKRNKSKLRAHRHRSQVSDVSNGGQTSPSPDAPSVEVTTPDAPAPGLNASQDEAHAVTTPDARPVSEPAASGTEATVAASNVSPSSQSGSTPPASADCYASGIPRRAMRILTPVDSKIPEAAPSVSDDGGERVKSQLSIAPPIEATAPAQPAQSDVSKEPETAARDADAATEKVGPPKLKVLAPPTFSTPDKEVGEANVIESDAKAIVPPDETVEIRDGDEINGGLIRRLRLARKISIEDLAKTTKVQRNVLTAIEEQDFEALPARVYLRGFLTQIARVLKVDRKRLADGYLDFVERHGTRS